MDTNQSCTADVATLPPRGGPLPPRETEAQQPSDAALNLSTGRDLARNVVPQHDVGDTSLHDDSRDYDIYRPGVKRLVVKIINIKFEGHEGLSDRNYAKADEEVNVFSENFGFETYDPLGKNQEVILNATKEDFLKILQNTKERVMKENIGCLVFIVSSHGTEKTVPQQGRVPEHREHCIVCSDGEFIMTKDMVDTFHTDFIRKTVPKLFIIQACRSEYGGTDTDSMIDAGITFYVKEEDSDNEEEIPVLADTARPPKKAEPGTFLPAIPPCAPDTVVIFGSAAGKYAYLGSEGSWILRSLNAEVDRMQEPEITLFALLNRVNCSQAAIHSKLKVKKPGQKSFITKSVTSAGSFTHQMTKSLTLKKDKDIVKQAENMDTS